MSRGSPVTLPLGLGPHRGDLLAQSLDMRVPAGDSMSNAQQRFIGHPHVVAEQRGRQVQPGHLGCRPKVGLSRHGVGREVRQLTPPAHGHDDNADQDRDGSEEQGNGHSKNRAMPADVVRHDIARPPSGRTLLIAVAMDPVAALAAVRAGADGVDLGAMTAASVARFRAAQPGVTVCTDGGPGDIVRGRQAAVAAGARLLCPGLDSASVAGLPRELLLVQASAADLAELVAAGWAVLVDADQAAGAASGAEDAPPVAAGSPGAASPPQAPSPPGRASPPAAVGTASVTGTAAIADVLAIAAISCWLGAAAVRTRHVGPVRRALDMTASIAGVRPPAAAIRGLA